MTESQIYTFKNIGANEKDKYKGKRVFERYETINYDFAKWFDDMVSDGKRMNADLHPIVWIHDFNNYKHGDYSGHYGDPRIDNPECLAVDFRWKGLSLHEGVMLAFKWSFNGIFFYPYANTPFVHADWKTWRRQEELIVYGYRDSKGNMITSTDHLPEVIRMLSMLND